LNTLYLAAVCAVVPGLGRSKIPLLLKKFGSAKALFEASEAELLNAGICAPKNVFQFIKKRSLDLPKRIDTFCKLNGVSIVSIYDEDYPKSLKEIHDPPLILYVRGEIPKFNYAIGVVGSREASHYGLKAASFFATGLAREGIPIISGGAKGIDAAAHEAALKAGGTTIAVLGCGLDIAYPASNQKLFERIAQNGAVISEYPPGTAPMSQNFPARNRIIVGLSRGIVVAEAAQKSGALITAHIAADEGREVYCVPGNIFENTSIGCHELIRQGAKLVDSVTDILEDKIAWQVAMQQKVFQPSIFEPADDKLKYSLEAVSPSFSKLGENILALLKQGPLSLEEITEQSGKSVSEISMELLELQVAGYIDMDNGNRYFRL
jgi:DNA processing protein